MRTFQVQCHNAVMGKSQIKSQSQITNHFNQYHKSNQVTMLIKCRKFLI